MIWQHNYSRAMGPHAVKDSAAAAPAAVAEAFTDKQYYLVSGYRLGIF